MVMEDEIISEDEESEFYKTLHDMFAGLPTITDINAKEVKLLVRLNLYGDVLKHFDTDNFKLSSYVDTLLDTYYKLKISQKRLGRKELFSTLKQTVEEEPEKNGLSSLLRKI